MAGSGRLPVYRIMASVKFTKGSEEWTMFMDFWGLCQKYWKPEKSDEWWDEALDACNDFARKYGNDGFPRGLAMALVRKLEEDWRRR